MLNGDQCMFGSRTAERCPNRAKWWHREGLAPWMACDKHHVEGDQRIPKRALKSMRARREKDKHKEGDNA